MEKTKQEENLKKDEVPKPKLYDKLGTYGACPLNLLQDKRITLNALKTYIALMSFEGNNAVAFPKLDELCGRAGFISRTGKLQLSIASRAVKLLEETGWISKERRGLGRSNRYKCKTFLNIVDDFKSNDNRNGNAEKLEKARKEKLKNRLKSSNKIKTDRSVDAEYVLDLSNTTSVEDSIIWENKRKSDLKKKKEAESTISENKEPVIAGSLEEEICEICKSEFDELSKSELFLENPDLQVNYKSDLQENYKTDLQVNCKADLQVNYKSLEENTKLKEHFKISLGKRTQVDKSTSSFKPKENDSLFSNIRKTFEGGSQELGAMYYHDSKEGKCIHAIIKRMKYFYGEKSEDASKRMLKIFYDKIRKSNSNYWRTLDFTPSKFLSNFNSINVMYAKQKMNKAKYKEFFKEFSF